MKTYEVTQVVEMMVTHKVRADSADEANDTATARTAMQLAAMGRERKNILFGDINDDYIPAMDEEPKT